MDDTIGVDGEQLVFPSVEEFGEHGYIGSVEGVTRPVGTFGETTFQCSMTAVGLR